MEVVGSLEEFYFFPESGSARFLTFNGFGGDFMDVDIVNNLNHVEIIRKIA